MWATFQENIAKVSDTISKECPGGLPGAAVMSIVTLAVVKYSVGFGKKRQTKAKIKRRQAKRQEGVDRLRQRLDEVRKEVDLSIIDLPFKELQKRLQTGQLSCRKVILAYQAKALSLHDKCNCVTGFIADAEERAARLDNLKPSERGPLHGIPMSMKEVVGVAGEDCTSAFSCFIDKPMPDYGIIMKVLIKQGAVPFARTNIAQGQVSLSSSNPLYGETSHPMDTSRSSGGSSGGEGTLVGGKGSILGLACDMGGSTRIPSHFCGACGLKPTQNRMSGAGNLPFGHGMVTLGEIYGPMGRDVDCLVEMMRSALVKDMFELDPLLPQLGWREEMFTSTQPLRIGYHTWDGGVEPVPAAKRAVALAKRALEAMGHTVVEFSPVNVVETCAKYGIGTVMSDNGEQFKGVTENDVVDPSISGSLMVPKIPFWFRNALSKLLYGLHPVEKKFLQIKTCGNIFQWWMQNEAVEELRRNFFIEMQKQKLDALICPTFPIPAWPLKDDLHAMACLTYTILYNVLNVPAGTMPVTRISAEDVKKMDNYPNVNGVDRFVHRISKGSENLPMSVQSVSYPFMEEVTLRVMKDVERGLQKLGKAYV